MRTHHGQVHENSISKINVECNTCGQTFEKWRYRAKQTDKHFCSKECWSDQGKRVERTCDYPKCDNTYETYNYRVEKGQDLCCSAECGMKNSRGGEYFDCENCGEELYRRPSNAKKDTRKYCSKKCKGIDLSGENHYAWKDETVYAPTYYGGWERRRNIRLETDNYECQECGSTDNLHVHHITPYREFDDPFKANEQENLITLCEKCHLSYEAGSKELTCV